MATWHLREGAGDPCNIPIQNVRDKVLYKGLVPKSELIATLETGCKEGLWLGRARSPNQILVGNREGVVGVWAVRKSARATACGINQMDMNG